MSLRVANPERNDGKYSVESARAYGWGPEAAPEPTRVAFLRDFVVGQSVLDIGCATGTYVDLLARRGLSATGVDAFPEFLDEAAKRGRLGHFVKAGVESLPFEDKSFDTTVPFAILEHLPDDHRAVQEVMRVTRRRILALVPLKDPPELLQCGFAFNHHVDRTHLREYSEVEARRLFQENGCSVVNVMPTYPASPRQLLTDSLTAPEPLRFMIRVALKMAQPLIKVHFSEVFVAADVPTA
jgi:SAM-dependent methyltransferase